MNVGDTVIDNNGKLWLVYDFMSYQCEDLLCVTDYLTEKENELISRHDVFQLIKKPKNVTQLFIKRREKVLEGELESYDERRNTKNKIVDLANIKLSRWVKDTDDMMENLVQVLRKAEKDLNKYQSFESGKTVLAKYEKWKEQK